MAHPCRLIRGLSVATSQGHRGDGSVEDARFAHTILASGSGSAVACSGQLPIAVGLNSEGASAERPPSVTSAGRPTSELLRLARGRFDRSGRNVPIKRARHFWSPALSGLPDVSSEELSQHPEPRRAHRGRRSPQATQDGGEMAAIGARSHLASSLNQPLPLSPSQAGPASCLPWASSLPLASSTDPALPASRQPSATSSRQLSRTGPYRSA